MAEGYKADLVAVFGHPVAENPTCVMQEAAFAAAGLNWRYLTVEVRPEDLADAVKGARAMGFAGFNCTIPHKVAVMPLLDEISPDAAMIGAVNTVRSAGGRLIGENTDGKGFLRGVREGAGVDPKGKRVTILGAGGAARAIAVELALAGAAELIVYNRSEGRGRGMVGDLVSRTEAQSRRALLISKGKSQGYLTYEELNRLLPNDAIVPEALDALVKQFEALGIELVDGARGGMRIGPRSPEVAGEATTGRAIASYRPWTGTVAVTAETDILVNATSIGLYPHTDAAPDVSLEQARADLLVCDVIPNPPETRFLREARGRGLRTLNGLAMLVYQGAIGFEMWTGRKASERAMREALEKAFGSS